ncbi:uncharacterized protein LOC143530188 [Bidens hawaiensis]|uniref:uncharacterized protein LOC143530188 n=1 Tax=Bidens hawaiensis TaxID=980011 RepID=UPI00404A6189
MAPILRYLQEGIVPENKQEARRLRIKALQYEIINGTLYRKSYLGPSLKCIGYEEVEYIIREIHEGICGMHMGAKMVAARAMRAGYYWPAMFLSALQEIRKRDSCQIYAPVTKKPKLNLIPVSSSWPFRKWGIDIVGPFPEGSGGIFREWCELLRIKQVFTSVSHPQANGQVERANRSIVEGIASRLGRERGSWVEELPHVLWAHLTMPKVSHGETPFSLTYGTEAMIPVEINVPTHQMRLTEQENENDLRLNLNFAEERREAAARREVDYKKAMKKYYNSRVREVKFKVGDLVLRENEASQQGRQGKLGA